MSFDGGSGTVQINEDGTFTLNVTDTDGDTLTITVTDGDGNTTTYTVTTVN